MKIFPSFLLLTFFCSMGFTNHAQNPEFYGPFSSWTNLKTQYHAKGDGIQDDTQALQTALNELGIDKHSPVLYIPSGIYVISSTLTMKSRLRIAIIGADPLNTILLWKGKLGQKMFYLNGVSYGQFSRLTWDGNHLAATGVAHEWDAKIPYANSGTEHSDEIFKNMGTGLKSGANMDAEFSIRRCRFYACSSTGISLQGWNALDWWIWDCYFENCHAGVANNFPGDGAGNFHVYRSIFINSGLADISIGNSEFYSFRDNISYHSKCFIRTRQGTNTSPITLQNNLILADTSAGPMADIFTKGNLLFLDNTFAPPQSSQNFVIEDDDNWNQVKPEITLIGNAFTASQNIVQIWGGNAQILDNLTGVAPPGKPNLTPKAFAPLVHYPSYEISPEMNAEMIQTIIDHAASTHHTSILHFNYGDYHLSKTLRIPAAAPLILYGDALSSFIKWDGGAGQSMLILDAPARAVIQNLRMNGNNKADIIEVFDNDKPGNSIYGVELISYAGVETNILVNGFSHLDIRLEGLQHNYCANGHSIRYIGRNTENSRWLKVFGCVSADNGNSYSVDKNARILVYDAWYEDGKASRFLSLKGRGEFVLNGAQIANTNKDQAAFIQVDSFSGKVVLAQLILNEPRKSIFFASSGDQASLLGLGILNWSDSTMKAYDIRASGESYALMHNRYNIGKGSFGLPDKGDTSAVFFKKHLAPIRENPVSATIPHTRTGALFILNRVMLENGVNNLHIERDK